MQVTYAPYNQNRHGNYVVLDHITKQVMSFRNCFRQEKFLTQTDILCLRCKQMWKRKIMQQYNSDFAFKLYMS